MKCYFSKMSSNQIFDYIDESKSERLARKSKEMPVFPIGQYVIQVKKTIA